MVVLPQETLDEIMEVVHRAADIQGATSKPADEWLTSEEARKILGVSSKTWQNYPDFIIGTPNLVRGLKVGVVHHE